jgi:hypothetical protein
MKRVRVDADGNCMFSAATVSAMMQTRQLDCNGILSNDDHMSVRSRALQLRQEVVQFMKDNENSFVPFIVEDFNAYVQQMLQPDTWGGEAELSAIARVKQCAVYVYKEREGSFIKFCSYEPPVEKRTAAIQVVFDGKHYDALV